MLSAGPDCGFLTARGYRAFKTGPLSRMAARREALARDITSIHGDEFMRVYGYRKVWRQLLDQGWDPLEAGRDQVARIMRELGLRGVRGGRRPVTTIPARGTGGRLDCFASIFLKQFLHYFSAVWAAGFQQELHHMTAQTRTGTGPPCLYIPET